LSKEKMQLRRRAEFGEFSFGSAPKFPTDCSELPHYRAGFVRKCAHSLLVMLCDPWRNRLFERRASMLAFQRPEEFRAYMRDVQFFFARFCVGVLAIFGGIRATRMMNATELAHIEGDEKTPHIEFGQRLNVPE
jgi:hypothetical protein